MLPLQPPFISTYFSKLLKSWPTKPSAETVVFSLIFPTLKVSGTPCWMLSLNNWWKKKLYEQHFNQEMWSRLMFNAWKNETEMIVLKADVRHIIRINCIKKEFLTNLNFSDIFTSILPLPPPPKPLLMPPPPPTWQRWCLSSSIYGMWMTWWG